MVASNKYKTFRLHKGPGKYFDGIISERINGRMKAH